MHRRKAAHLKTRQALSEQDKLEGSLKKQFEQGKGYAINTDGTISTAQDSVVWFRNDKQ